MPLKIAEYNAFKKHIINRDIKIEAAAGAVIYNDNTTKFISAVPLTRKEYLKLRPGRPVGAVIELNGHYLVDKLFFSVLPLDGAEKDTDIYYTNILKAANREKIKSIVFPPLFFRSHNSAVPYTVYEKARISIEKAAADFPDMEIYLAVYENMDFSELFYNQYMEFKKFRMSVKNGEKVSEDKARQFTERFTAFQQELFDVSVNNDYMELPPFEASREKFLDYIYKYTENISNSALAEKACIDHSTVSKIINSAEYNTSLETVAALAIAMELSREERYDFIRNAGYVAYPSTEKEKAIETAIGNGTSTVIKVNEELHSINPKWILTGKKDAVKEQKVTAARGRPKKNKSKSKQEVK